MSLTKTQKAEWEKAQQAEKGHWQDLWSKDINVRKALFEHEAAKADFIFKQMTTYFFIDPAEEWSKLSVMDVGCGPASIVARAKYGKSRIGVDPLKYPDWIYADYDKNGFKVILQPFEELKTDKLYDIIIFYNALQHFADLNEVASQTKKLLTKNGRVYLSEYLDVPTNEAHIQLLQKDSLDQLFSAAGFNVNSAWLPARLPGLVERPNGQTIDLYVACLTDST